jgi:inorganic triphosphatase YgiF
LRVRSAGDRHIQTIKSGDGSGAGMFDRSEWETELESDEPDLSVATDTPVAELLGGKRKRLRPVFQTVIDRTTWQIKTDQSAIEIALDQGEVVANGTGRPISELELELKRGSAEDLFEIARSLDKKRPLRIGVLAKAERGYALAADEAPGSFKAGHVAIEPGMSTAAAFRAIARSCIRHFRLNEPILIERRSAEALHQSRVAIRRLRSALSLFKDVIADGELETVKVHLREISRELGEARNLDVYLGHAIRSEAEQDGSEPGLSEFISRLEEDRTKAYDQVTETLQSATFRQHMLGLLAWIEAGPWLAMDDPDRAALRDRPIERFASDILDQRRRKVKKTGRNLDKLDAEARHQVRIHAKKLRYASEFFAALVSGKKASRRRKRFIKALEHLQACLGDLNDIETGRSMTENLARSEGEASEPSSHLFAAGHVSGRQDARHAGLLTSAEQAYGALARAKPFWN